jgi:hypothetical protein
MGGCWVFWAATNAEPEPTRLIPIMPKIHFVLLMSVLPLSLFAKQRQSNLEIHSVLIAAWLLFGCQSEAERLAEADTRALDNKWVTGS